MGYWCDEWNDNWVDVWYDESYSGYRMRWSVEGSRGCCMFQKDRFDTLVKAFGMQKMV